jgi:hypothetical protein
MISKTSLCVCMATCTILVVPSQAQLFVGVATQFIGFEGTNNGLRIAGDGQSLFTTVLETQDTGAIYRWRLTSGVERFLPDRGVTDVSFYGDTLAATSSSQNYRYRNGSGFDTVPLSTIYAISGDGETVVGNTGFGAAARWTLASGVSLLPAVQPVAGYVIGGPTFPIATSFDGSTVLMQAGARPTGGNFFFRHAVRWTSTGGARFITDLNGGFLREALDMSDDGRAIIGTGDNTYLGTYLWRDDNSVIGIPQFDLGVSGPRPKISGDASTIIYRTLMWTEQGGVVPLTSVLSAAGCDFTGWTNLTAVTISDNARALAGYGTNPQGQTEVWYATVPSPGVICVSMVLGMMCARRRR